MRDTYWLAGFVTLLALVALFVVWREQSTPVPPPAPVTLPAAETTTTAATYYCSDDKTMHAVFNTGSLALTLSDGRSFTLPQQLSGSGMRYEDQKTRYGTDVIFIGKGDNAFLTEDGQTTYAACTAAFVEASDAPGYELYTDQGKTFSFAFPADFSVAGSAVGLAPGWVANATTSGQILAKILVPKSYEPGTNFGDATFTVSTSADPAAVASCLTVLPMGTATTTTIGGLPFTKLTFRDAAAGNRYDTTSYRLVRDGTCWALEYTIHYGAIENYPKGSVQAFDEPQVTSALDEVAQSFEFLQ